MDNKETRCIDDLGRIHIPKLHREKANIKEGDRFEIIITEDGNILLVKVTE
jgi:AbrB family looped-hinge helix DNA binding protein